MTQHNEVQENKGRINSHLVLAVVALCLTPFGGILSLPAAIAALIFALKSENEWVAHRHEEAKHSAKYANIFGWVSIALFFIPWIIGIIVVFFFLGIGLAVL